MRAFNIIHSATGAFAGCIAAGGYPIAARTFIHANYPDYTLTRILHDEDRPGCYVIVARDEAHELQFRMVEV